MTFRCFDVDGLVSGVNEKCASPATKVVVLERGIMIPCRTSVDDRSRPQPALARLNKRRWFESLSRTRTYFQKQICLASQCLCHESEAVIEDEKEDTRRVFLEVVKTAECPTRSTSWRVDTCRGRRDDASRLKTAFRKEANVSKWQAG